MRVFHKGVAVGALFFIKGLLVGFVICAPVGPIGLLCMRRALVEGRLAGMAAVLGASFVDALYCSLAGLGITYIATILTGQHLPIRIAGGLLVVAVGVRIFFARPSEKLPESEGQGLLSSFLSSFLMMLANPMPILVFTATLTALGLHGWEDAWSATAAMVAGVFFGSALWAPILAALVGRLTPQFKPRYFRLLNRVVGILMASFGLGVCLAALLG